MAQAEEQQIADGHADQQNNVNEIVEPVEGETPEKVEQGSVPLSAHTKLRSRAQDAETRLAEVERKLEAAKQEANLAKLIQPLNNQEDVDLNPPNPDDYIDGDDWRIAFNEYTKKTNAKQAQDTQDLMNKQFTEREQKQIQTVAETKSQQEQAVKLEAYYERADKLGATDFVEAEEKLQKVWSPWFMDMVRTNFDNSEQVIYTLANDPEKAQELAAGFDNNQISGGLALFKFAGSINPLKDKPGDQPPEPDEAIKGGAGGVTLQSATDKKLDQIRADHRAGKFDMTELIRRKKALLG